MNIHLCCNYCFARRPLRKYAIPNKFFCSREHHDAYARAIAVEGTKVGPAAITFIEKGS